MTYDFWLILVVAGIATLALGTIDTFRKDLGGVDWKDLLLFATGFLLLLIAAPNSATLNFITSNGQLIQYSGYQWAIIPLFGLSFTSMGLALMVIILSVLHRNELTVQD
jgi:hypothetical protein